VYHSNGLKSSRSENGKKSFLKFCGKRGRAQSRRSRLASTEQMIQSLEFAVESDNDNRENQESDFSFVDKLTGAM